MGDRSCRCGIWQSKEQGTERMEEVVVGFFLWIGRGILHLFVWVFDLHFIPTLIRFPGTVILECTVGSNRYTEDRPTVAEYVVGTLFWLAVLFGIYMLVR